MTKCESAIIANFDDDDIYYPEYMRGMLYWQLQAGEGMASKGNIVARDESLGYIGWLLTDIEPRPGFAPMSSYFKLCPGKALIAGKTNPPCECEY